MHIALVLGCFLSDHDKKSAQQLIKYGMGIKEHLV